MAQKCLIIYASRTGNTEKIAQVFKDTFEKNDWQCDMFKIKEGIKPEELPYKYEDYDFMCAGSPVHNGLAVPEIITALRQATSKREIPHEKIVPGPKMGIVFATYSGAHLGPREAETALVWMAVEMEHHKFKSIGQFACPGKFIQEETPTWWHGTLLDRPNERDLQKAELFMEDIIEVLAVRHENQ